MLLSLFFSAMSCQLLFIVLVRGHSHQSQHDDPGNEEDEGDVTWYSAQ